MSWDPPEELEPWAVDPDAWKRASARDPDPYFAEPSAGLAEDGAPPHTDADYPVDYDADFEFDWEFTDEEE